MTSQDDTALSRRAFLATAAIAPAALAVEAPHRPRVLRAAAAVAKITPGKGVTLDGTITKQGLLKAIHDDLFARALVLDDGTTRIAFVVIDSTMIGPQVHTEVKRLIKDRTGIDPDHVVTAATHSHMAVRLMRSNAERNSANAKYHKYVVRQVADAVARAVEQLAPAKVGWGVAPKPEYCKNRRWLMKPGALGPNPFGEFTDQATMHGSPAKDRIRTTGPIDPGLSVLSVQHADGRPLAMLANYSIHYAGMVKGNVSADYFGFFAKRMAELLDRKDGRPPFVAMMSNGTSGDINRAQGGNFEGMKKVGHGVAETAMEIYGKIEHRADVTLAAEASTLDLTIRRPDAERIAWARAVQAGTWKKPAHKWRNIYAQNALELAKYPPTVKLPLSAFRIGDMGIAVSPCETFAETGLAIKAGSPLKPTFTIGLANGQGGYLPPPAQHKLGGYTTWPAESSYLEVGAEPKIRAELLRLLKKVRGAPEAG